MYELFEDSVGLLWGYATTRVLDGDGQVVVEQGATHDDGTALRGKLHGIVEQVVDGLYGIMLGCGDGEVVG